MRHYLGGYGIWAVSRNTPWRLLGASVNDGVQEQSHKHESMSTRHTDTGGGHWPGKDNYAGVSNYG